MNSALRDKLLKISKDNKYANILSNSQYIGKVDYIDTGVPAINIALSADIDGGLSSGITILAGPSRHFKSGFALLMAAAFLRKHENGIVLFFDSEFGMPIGYFETFNIDPEKVVHIPILNVEELKFQAIKYLEAVERDEPVMIIIDSLGNLASRKEVSDALDENAARDMSRAGEIKSFYRIITPYTKLKNIPVIVINHTYKTMEKFSKDVISGGNGNYYSSDNIWIIGRSQEKDDDELAGFKFTINVEKSRFVKEKSKIPIIVKFEDGIDKWSGMFDIALEGGFITTASKGWYQEIDSETGELIGNKRRRAELENDDEFWKRLMTPKFKNYVKNTFQISSSDSILEKEEVENQVESE